MNYFISQQDVEASIEYFKNAGFDSNDMLILFFLSKHMGISTSFPITYGSGLDAAQKNECLNAIWMLGGLFDSTEQCGKRGIIFPTGFNRSEMYNPGTDFSSAVGRVRDTIKQKVNTLPLYNYNEGIITLTENYKDLLKDSCLKGQKISLSKFAAWTFRFVGFDFEQEPTVKQFSRVVDRAIKKFIKATKNDFSWLLEDDLSIFRLTPSTSSITGTQLRNHFSFEAGKSPEIKVPESGDITQSRFISRDTVESILHSTVITQMITIFLIF